MCEPKPNSTATSATLQLMNELSKGKKSGEEKGWLSAEEVREHFKEKAEKF